MERGRHGDEEVVRNERLREEISHTIIYSTQLVPSATLLAPMVFYQIGNHAFIIVGRVYY